MRFLFLLNIIISFLYGQKHLDMLITEVLSGSRDSAAIYLPIIEKQYPNNPSMLFLKGLLETKGEDAMQIFVELYNNHPSSKYGDDAVMKVGEYYYASGLYIQSAEWLKKMPIYFSRSEHIERAVKLFLNSLIVSGHRDTAIYYSRVFKRQFPSLDVEGKISDLLEDYENSKKTSKSSIKPISEKNQEIYNPAASLLSKKTKVDNKSNGYSLQSGAFSLEENAVNQKNYIMNAGFSARIAELSRHNKILYIVRIGYFSTSQEADEIGKKIKSNLDLNTIVVKNN